MQAPQRPRLPIPAAVLLSTGLLLSACGLRGSGTPATETRELEAFDRIEIGGTFNLVVHVAPGAAQKLELTADDNIVTQIQTTVSGGELDVGFDFGDSSFVRPKTPIRVEVWLPSLAAIEASGASDIEVVGLHGDSFELELSGASDVELLGAVEQFNLEISGAGDLDAKGLETKRVVLEISGSGEADVWASEQLDVAISGSGEVNYWGNPATVNQAISGSGKLESRG